MLYATFFLMLSFKASRSVSVFYFTDTFHSINAYHVLTGSSVLLGMQRARLDSGWVSNEECDSWSLQGQVIIAIANNFFISSCPDLQWGHTSVSMLLPIPSSRGCSAWRLKARQRRKSLYNLSCLSLPPAECLYHYDAIPDHLQSELKT